MPSQLTYNVCILAYEGVNKATIENNFLSRINQEEYKITLDVDLPVDAIVKSKANLQYWIYSYSSITDKTKWEEMIFNKIQKSNGIIMFYDLTNAETLNLVAKKIQAIQESLSYVPPILLVGNELDLEENREISEEQLQKFKETNNISSSIELSLKTGENVENAFLTLTEMVLRTDKPDYRLDAKRINIRKIMSDKQSKYAFLTLLIMIVATVVVIVFMYFNV